MTEEDIGKPSLCKQIEYHVSITTWILEHEMSLE